MRVECEVKVIEIDNGSAKPVESVCVTCTRCDHETESFGTGGASVRRCLALLREQCPKGEENYYVEEDE